MSAAHAIADEAPDAGLEGDIPLVETKAEADDLITHLTETMQAMQSVIEAETRLVKAAKMREAMRLADEKTRVVHQYRTLVRALKVNGDALRRMAPERMERVRERHNAFRLAVTSNLKILHAAREVSENLVRSVSTDLHDAAANTPLFGTRRAGRRGARDALERRSPGLRTRQHIPSIQPSHSTKSSERFERSPQDRVQDARTRGRDR